LQIAKLEGHKNGGGKHEHWDDAALVAQCKTSPAQLRCSARCYHDFHEKSHYCQRSKVNILKNMGSHGTLDDVDGRAKLAGRGQLTSGDERVRSEVPERNKEHIATKKPCQQVKVMSS
jgi:hypothetical protein